mmetsp:Transcript_19505/g.52544  ORF Transcript_19505/g.52544 Transcript_19505/m.52544 type:complete len:520 (+) Transcript_19505:132-1691(+)
MVRSDAVPAAMFAYAKDPDDPQKRAATHLARVREHAVTCRDAPSSKDWAHTEVRDDFTAAEVALAKRCHGAHLETLAGDDVTPIASHYQLIHFDVPTSLREENHTLSITGLVANERTFSVSDLRSRERRSETVVLECAGQGRACMKRRFWTHVPWGVDAFGCARWTGCSLADVLREAGPLDEAAQVVFTGADKGVQGGEVQYFQRSLPLRDALNREVLLCYEMNGQPLPRAHGYPLRLIVPGWYGMASVKWLTNIEITRGDWWGYQMDAYTFADAPAHLDLSRVPVQQQQPRALMVPPGYPDFFTRTRVVAPGSLETLQGRAWGGYLGVAAVEVSTDGGHTWQRAELEAAPSALGSEGAEGTFFGWRRWTFEWSTPSDPGECVLACRAVDSRGHPQDPQDDADFNYYAFASTHPQCVYVRVDENIRVPGSRVDMDAEVRASKPSILTTVSLRTGDGSGEGESRARGNSGRVAVHSDPDGDRSSVDSDDCAREIAGAAASRAPFISASSADALYRVPGSQ